MDKLNESSAILANKFLQDENSKLREQLVEAESKFERALDARQLHYNRAEAAEAQLEAASEQEPFCRKGDIAKAPLFMPVNQQLEPLYAAPIPPADVQELLLEVEALRKQVSPEMVDAYQWHQERIAELERKLAEQQAAMSHAYVTLNACEESDNPNHGVSDASRILAKIDCAQLDVFIAKAREEGTKEAVPDGWWVVPIERNYAQRAQGLLHFNSANGDLDDKLQVAWEAMLAAAPKPEVKP